MRLTKTLRTAMAALVLLALCAQGLPFASAVSGTYEEVKGADCTLTVEFAPEGEPMANAAFRIWRVAALSGDGFRPVGDIGRYHVLEGQGSWLAKAGTLLAYLQRDKVPPAAAASTGEDGKVTFQIPAAEQGLYLVHGDSQERDGRRYTPTPFLIMAPCCDQDMGVWETAVETYSKVTVKPSDPEPIQRHVLKSWNDNGHEDARPAEILVDLLRDGEVFDTAALTAAGSWRHDWTDLDPQYEWAVVERESGQYTVLVEQAGVTFHITNTWRDTPGPNDPGPNDPGPNDPGPNDPGTEDPPLIDIPDSDPPLDDKDIPDVEIPDEDPPLSDDPGLPQTGQLWWPVAPMALGGLVLAALGWKRRRSWSASDET